MQTSPQAQDRWLLASILLLAAAVRAISIIWFPRLFMPDEVYQTVEPAHRLIYGYGITTWEYKVGIRSWILPGFIAAILKIASSFSDSPSVLTKIVQAVFASISLVVVWCAFWLGRTHSRSHAVICGLVAATWFEFVFHSQVVLTEIIATAPYVGALYLYSTQAFTRRAAFALGLCLGIAFVLRFHLVLGLAVIAAAALWRFGPRSFLPLLLGGGLPVLVMGLVDWATWGAPFIHIVNNYTQNIVHGRAVSYGVGPIDAYYHDVKYRWLYAAPVIFVLVALAARRYPVWLLSAVAIIAMHSLIAHKEHRFIAPPLAALTLLAAIGSGHVVQWLRTARGAGWARAALALVLVGWLGTSAGLALSDTFRSRWVQGRGELMAFHWLHGQGDLCGVGVQGIRWGRIGGYSHLHRPVPIHIEATARPVTTSLGGFNYLLVEAAAASAPPGYTRVACFDGHGAIEICALRRPGTCDGPGPNEFSRVLAEQDQ